MSTPQLRPLAIGEILDVSLKIAWRNAGALIRIVLVVVAPAQALIALIRVSAVPDYRPGGSGIFPTTDTTLSGGDEWTYLAATLVTVVIGFVAGQLATGASFRAVAQAYLGERRPWRESLRFAVSRLHSIVWVVVLGAIVTVLGFVLIVPGVYFSVAFAVALPVLMTEGLRGRQALGRSRRLVQGRWWKTALLLFLAALLAGIVGAVIAAAVAALAFAAPDSPVVLFFVGAVSGTVSSLATTPFSAAYHTVLYFDLRVRREAFDLQLLAQHLGVEPPEGWTPPAEVTPFPEDEEERPPFWPPPPGWKPRTGQR